MEAGDGRRAQTVYLKPKKKVPAPVLASLAHPPANFSSSSAPFLSSQLFKGQADSSLRLSGGDFLGASAISTSRGCLVPLALTCWAVLRASESKAGVYQRERVCRPCFQEQASSLSYLATGPV